MQPKLTTSFYVKRLIGSKNTSDFYTNYVNLVLFTNKRCWQGIQLGDPLLVIKGF